MSEELLGWTRKPDGEPFYSWEDEPHIKTSGDPIIGQIGEFTDGMGRVTQCVVTGVDAESDTMIEISYFNREAQARLTGFIGRIHFRKDETP